jgi:hypothetical protein
MAVHSADSESLFAKDQGKLGAIRPCRCPAESPWPGTRLEKDQTTYRSLLSLPDPNHHWPDRICLANDPH